MTCARRQARVIDLFGALKKHGAGEPLLPHAVGPTGAPTALARFTVYDLPAPFALPPFAAYQYLYRPRRETTDTPTCTNTPHPTPPAVSNHQLLFTNNPLPATVTPTSPQNGLGVISKINNPKVNRPTKRRPQSSGVMSFSGSGCRSPVSRPNSAQISQPFQTVRPSTTSPAKVTMATGCASRPSTA